MKIGPKMAFILRVYQMTGEKFVVLRCFSNAVRPVCRREALGCPPQIRCRPFSVTGKLIMKRRISEEELFLVITRDRLSEMFGEACANGLTFPEICFPGTGRRRVLAACRDPRTRHDGKDARLYFNQLTRQRQPRARAGIPS